MIALSLVLVLVLALVTLFAYVERIYRERGKFLDRQFQDNLDTYERDIEPQLKTQRDRAQLTAALWVELGLGVAGILIGCWTVGYTQHGWLEGLEAAIVLVGAVILTTRVIPFLLFARTEGRWLLRLLPLLRGGLVVLAPLSALVSFGASLATLSEPEQEEADPEQKRESEIEALVDAGAEEGIIEEDERDLVESALSFSDKRAREIMVPRPDIVALPASTTLVEWRALLRRRHYARIPVYSGDIDHIQGVVHARELLLVGEQELGRHTVAEYLRPVLFIPEAETAAELLREMKQQRVHTAIVINEYGGVAGLVSFSDVLEELVGEMPDAHTPAIVSAWVAEGEGRFVAAGSLELDRVNQELDIDIDSREVTTLAGFLAEQFGRIPVPGERLEAQGYEFQVLEANDVRILKVRIQPAPRAVAADGAAGTDAEGAPSERALLDEPVAAPLPRGEGGKTP